MICTLPVTTIENILALLLNVNVNCKMLIFFQFFINKSERAWFEAEKSCDKIRVSKNFQ